VTFIGSRDDTPIAEAAVRVGAAPAPASTPLWSRRAQRRCAVTWWLPVLEVATAAVQPANAAFQAILGVTDMALSLPSTRRLGIRPPASASRTRNGRPTAARRDRSTRAGVGHLLHLMSSPILIISLHVFGALQVTWRSGVGSSVFQWLPLAVGSSRQLQW